MSSRKSRSKCLPQTQLPTHKTSDKLLASTSSLRHHIQPTTAAVFSSTSPTELYDQGVATTLNQANDTNAHRTQTYLPDEIQLQQEQDFLLSNNYCLPEDFMLLNMPIMKRCATLMPPSSRFHEMNAIVSLEMGEELNTPVICSSEPDYNQTTLNASHLHKLYTVDGESSSSPLAMTPPDNFYTNTTTTTASNNNNNNNNINAMPSASTSTEPSPIYSSQFDFDIMYDPYSAEHSNDIDFLKYQNQINTATTTAVTAATNINTAESSPLGRLGSAADDEDAANDEEQSFIFESTSCGAILPIKYSQDYDDEHGGGGSIFDEVKQITTSGFYYNNNNNVQAGITTTPSAALEMAVTSSNIFKFADSQSSDLKFKIYQDEDDDEDSTCLETVERFSDVMINGQLIQPQQQQQQINNKHISEGAFKSNNFNIIKKEHIEEHNYNAKASIILLENTSKNVTSNSSNNNNNRMRVLKSVACKRKLVMAADDDGGAGDEVGAEKKMCMSSSADEELRSTHSFSHSNNSSSSNRNMKRVPPLKIKIPVMLAEEIPMTTTVNTAAIVNTPDIANDILAMEDDIFDLIKFIDCPTKSANVVPEVVDDNHDAQQYKLSMSQQQQLGLGGGCDDDSIPSVDESTGMVIIPTPTIDDVVRMLTSSSASSSSSSSLPTSTVKHQQRKRAAARLDSYDNPDSVQSMSSDDSSSAAHTNRSSTCSTPAAKRRGRPPKTTPTIVTASQLSSMTEEDIRYLEMRNKNNEASRRSRINRKGREQVIEEEAYELESRFAELQTEEQRLERQCQKWRKALLRLAAH